MNRKLIQTQVNEVLDMFFPYIDTLDWVDDKYCQFMMQDLEPELSNKIIRELKDVDKHVMVQLESSGETISGKIYILG